MNATQLRAELYRVLDRVLLTGRPVTIERKGRRLRLSVVEDEPEARHKRWPTPDPGLVNGDPDLVLAVDWSKEWRP